MKLAPPSIYRVIEAGKLRAYQFSVLSETRHAVFTRLGGVSGVPWRGLNMSSSVGDVPANVAQNFALACQTLNVSPRKTATCHLVHGNEVMVVGGQASLSSPVQFADAIITRQVDVVLTMRFADCVPLLFYDRVGQAIGLGHAGWRGTMKNVMGTVVEAMRTHFHSRPQNIVVIIGPSIGPCCYQVGQEVLHIARETFADPRPFFIGRRADLYFDMWQANVYQARQAGLQEIIVSELCTACRTDEFFSHRAEKGATGRFGVFLGLPEKEVS